MDQKSIPPTPQSEQYRLDIIGMQKIDGSSTSVETHCPCTITYRNNHLYIQYTEEELSKLIIVSENRVQLRTLGDKNSRMEFIPGTLSDGSIRTPYGILSIRINTKQLSVDDKLLTEGTVTVYMEYDLMSEDTIVSVNKLDLRISKPLSHH